MKEQNNKTNHMDSPGGQYEENIELKATAIPSREENSVKHSMNLLRAALPYVGANAKHSVEIMVKATELLDSISDPPAELAALSMNEARGDMEGMLTNIKACCTDRERDLVDMVLNFIKAQKFYTTYRNVSLTGPHRRNDGNNPYAHILGLDENVSMMEMLTSMLSPEQKSTFETLNMVLSTMQSSTS